MQTKNTAPTPTATKQNITIAAIPPELRPAEIELVEIKHNFNC